MHAGYSPISARAARAVPKAGVIFVIVLTLGLVLGLVDAVFLLHRWNVSPVAALGTTAAGSIIILSLPVGLSLRVGLVVGLLLGFLTGMGGSDVRSASGGDSGS